MALSRETLADITREAAELEARLDVLRRWQSWQDLAAEVVADMDHAKRGNGRAKTKVAAEAAPARKPRVSAETKASRALQGEYLALIRRFAKSKRPAFGKIAKEKGREKAIREMKAALKAKDAKKKAPKTATE